MSTPLLPRAAASPSAAWRAHVACLGLLALTLGTARTLGAQSPVPPTAPRGVMPGRHATGTAPRPPVNAGARRARRALHVATAVSPIRVDGHLDDAAWAATEPSSGFTQIEPRQGRPATFGTEVRLAQDATHLYVAMRGNDPLGAAGLRARDLRRDFFWGRSDSMGLIVDGVGDRRSILAFGVSAFGAQWDAQVTDGGLVDVDWDGVWRVRTTADSAGWTAEFAIPWATLRYAPGADSTPGDAPIDVLEGGGGGDAASGPPTRAWRINFTRESPRIGETSALSEFPRNFGPFRMEFAATLLGVHPPAASPPVTVRPYVVMAQRTVGDRDGRANAGGELRWQPAASTTVDVTVNTDFAQADVDRQVVNLTRFNVFFPERRPFFLEHRGLFTVGAPERLLPFFTRSVGLTANGTPLPIDGGVRAVYRGAGWSGGALAMRQGAGGAHPASTLGVLRLQRTAGARFRMGALLVERRADRGVAGPAAGAPAGASSSSSAGTTVAIDAFARPVPSVTVNALVSATAGSGSDAGGGAGDGWAWWGEVVRSTPRFETAVSVEHVGRTYAPSAGFVARHDLLRATSRAIADWRPSWRPAAIRGFRPSLQSAVAWRASDRSFQEGQVTARLFGADFVDRGRAFLDVVGDWQSLDRPFAVVPGVVVPPGEHADARVVLEYQSSYARRLAVTVGGTYGGYFGGRLRSTSTRVAWAPSPRVVVEGAHTMAAFEGIGDRGDRTETHLLAPELRLAASPRMQLSVFYQHNTALRQGALNARFVWEYAPLSTLAIVYNARAPIVGNGASTPPARDGQLVMKLSWAYLP